MSDSNYIIHFIKEYFAIIFYLFIISNIVIRVIITKKSKKKKKKKKSRRGGGIGDVLLGIGDVLLCIITFGWSCGIWSGLDDLYQDLEKKKEETESGLATPWRSWSRAPFNYRSTWRTPDAIKLWESTTRFNNESRKYEPSWR